MNIVEETIINIFKLPKLEEYGKIMDTLEYENKSRSKNKSLKGVISKKNKKKPEKRFRFKLKLFRKKTMKKKISKVQSSKKKVILLRSYLNKIPSNSFGVFVTIHRENDKLPSYPTDVHGCIGNWDNTYRNVSPEKIYSDIMDVSIKATFEDDRRQYFPPLEDDVFSRVEISYLLTPLYKILTKRSNNKIIGWIDKLKEEFNNKKFGLIVDGPHRATYLPDVFENIDWLEIKKSLLQKAGLNSEQEVHASFYAYLSQVEKESIFELIYNKLNYNNSYPRKIANCFIKFLMLTADNNIIPYNVSSLGEITFKNEEIIRNLSVLQTLLTVNEVSLNDKGINIKKVEELFLEYLKVVYEKIDKINEFELANLILAIFKLNRKVHDNTKNNSNTHDFLFPIDEKYIKKLVSRIKTSEKVFERNQIILAVLSYLYYSKEKLSKEVLEFSKEIVNMYKSESEFLSIKRPTVESVFKLNWDSQVLCKIHELLDDLVDEVTLPFNNRKVNQNYFSINDEPRMVLKSDIGMLLKKNLDNFKEIFNKTSLDQLNNIETNYLAVSFEGLMTIFKYINPKELPIQASIAFKIFLILMTRFNPENGLIYFKSNEARIDITCHFLNGF